MPRKTIDVFSETDLPPVVNDRYTGEADVTYVFKADITLDFGFDVTIGGVALIGAGYGSTTITYTGTDPFVVGGQVELRSLNIEQTQVSTLVDLDGGTNDYFIARDIILPSNISGGIGEVSNIGKVDVSGIDTVDVNNGLKLFGTNWQYISIRDCNLNSTNGSFLGIDFSSCVFSNCIVSGVRFNAPASADALFINGGNANVTAGNIALVTNCDFAGGINPITGGGSITDIRWNHSSNRGLLSSVISTDPVTQTTFNYGGSQNNWYKVYEGWTASNESRMSMNINGDIFTDMEIPIIIEYKASISLRPTTSGGTDRIEMMIVRNNNTGSFESTRTTVKAGTGTLETISTSGIFTMNPGDQLNIFVRNQDSNDTIQVQRGVCSTLREL